MLNRKRNRKKRWLLPSEFIQAAFTVFEKRKDRKEGIDFIRAFLDKWSDISTHQNSDTGGDHQIEMSSPGHATDGTTYGLELISICNSQLDNRIHRCPEPPRAVQTLSNVGVAVWTEKRQPSEYVVIPAQKWRRKTYNHQRGLLRGVFNAAERVVKVRGVSLGCICIPLNNAVP